MDYLTEYGWQQRAKSMGAVCAIHVVIGYALVSGLGMEVAKTVTAGFKVIHITPPMPSEPVPAKKPAEALEEAASPENLRAAPTQIVAPEPEIKLEIESPVIAAPIAGPGDESKAGASDQAGPGFGSGGQGDGYGGGGIVSGRAICPARSVARIYRDRFGNPATAVTSWRISQSAPMAGQAIAGSGNRVAIQNLMPPLAS